MIIIKIIIVIVIVITHDYTAIAFLPLTTPI